MRQGACGGRDGLSWPGQLRRQWIEFFGLLSVRERAHLVSLVIETVGIAPGIDFGIGAGNRQQIFLLIFQLSFAYTLGQECLGLESKLVVDRSNANTRGAGMLGGKDEDQ